MYVGQGRGGSRLLCIAQWSCSKPGQCTAARLHQAPVKPMGRPGNQTCSPQLSTAKRSLERTRRFAVGGTSSSLLKRPWALGAGRSTLHVLRGATLERCLAAATGVELVDGVHCARCSLRACLAAAAGAPAAAPMRAASKAPRPLVQPAAWGERRDATAPPAPPCSPALPAPLRPAESSGCDAGAAMSPRGGACAACGCAGRRASCTDRRCLADPAAALQAGGPHRAGAAAMPALHQHPADAPGGVRCSSGPAGGGAAAPASGRTGCGGACAAAAAAGDAAALDPASACGASAGTAAAAEGVGDGCGEGFRALEALASGRGPLPAVDARAAATAAGLAAHWRPRLAPALRRALLARVPQVRCLLHHQPDRLRDGVSGGLGCGHATVADMQGVAYAARCCHRAALELRWQPTEQHCCSCGCCAGPACRSPPSTCDAACPKARCAPAGALPAAPARGHLGGGPADQGGRMRRLPARAGPGALLRGRRAAARAGSRPGRSHAAWPRRPGRRGGGGAAPGQPRSPSAQAGGCGGPPWQRRGRGPLHHLSLGACAARRACQGERRDGGQCPARRRGVL